MVSIEKITRHPYINNIRKINEVIDELNRLLASYEKDVWRLDKNINKIAKNTDLNSLITQGTYTCPDATVAATLGHTPHTSSNFRLVVTENIDGYISQLVYVYNDAIYIRGRSGGSKPTWTDWHKNAWTDSDITGNAATATKLKTPVSLQTNLASSSPANFDGSQNVSFGVTGVLPVSHGGTGKTNLNDVKVGSASHADEASYATKAGNVEPELIPANVDLNSYTHYGLYYCPKNADAATIGHCPTDGNAFALVVLLEAGVAQICVQYGTNTHNIYHRNYYNGAWGDWALLITDKNIKIYFDEIEDVIRTVRGDGTDKYPHIDTRIDEGDFLNMAPKIGRYQEDQVNVTASYNISNIPYGIGMVPYVTSDGFERKIAYFVGDGGGPHIIGQDPKLGLHKGYYDDINKEWVFYNTNVIPQCLANKEDLSFKRIYGVGNNWIIVEVLEGNTTKFYRIITNNDFNEERWVKCQDITNIFIGDTNRRIPGAEDVSYTRAEAAKYIQKYHTIAVIWYLSNNLKVDDWYYLTLWDCGTDETKAPTFVYGQPFSGPGPVVQLADGYTFDKGTNDKRTPADSELSSIGVDSAGAPTGSCAAFIFESKNTISICWYHMRFPVYQNDTGTFSRPGLSLQMSYTVSPNNFFNTSKTLSRSITLNQEPGDISLHEMSQYRKDVDALNSGLSIRDVLNGTSYDEVNAKAYSIGTNQTKQINIKEVLLSKVINTNTKLNGLKIENNEIIFLPDGSLWGKTMGHGIILWDHTYIGCRDKDNQYLLKVNNWQFIHDAGFGDQLFVEPQPADYVKIEKSKFTDKINADVVPGSRNITKEDLFNSNYMPFTSQGNIRGITSVKTTSGIAEYYLAQLDKSNNIIKWRQFLPDNNYTEIKYANDTDPTLTVTGLTPDKFNTGDPNKTYIYPGFVAYNPLSKRFYIFGMTFDSTEESAQPNLRLPHIVGVNAQTGAVIQFKNPSNKVSQPSDYQWSESGYPGTVSHTSNYTPFMPYGCTVISATKMVVFFNCATPGNAISIYGLVYTFSSDGSKLESVTDYNFHSYGGVSHYQVYNTPDCARMFLIYSGPLYGLCGTGVTVPVARDYQRDNYRVDIRTQKPLLGTRDIENDYTENQVLEDFVENTNTYSMFNQSASGLIAQIPSMDIFIGGYYTHITSGENTRVKLKANATNYIYARRGKKEDGTPDRNKVEFFNEITEPVLTPGMSSFNKLLLAKIKTDEHKPVSTKIYTINTRYNSWKFQKFNPGYDELIKI